MPTLAVISMAGCGDAVRVIEEVTVKITGGASSKVSFLGPAGWTVSSWRARLRLRALLCPQGTGDSESSRNTVG